MDTLGRDLGGYLSLSDILSPESISTQKFSAWPEFKPTLNRMIARLPARRVLEIGGGRQPFFSQEEADSRGFELTINDIDEAELALAPSSMRRTVFDVTGDIDAMTNIHGQYDLVFSRMVFEHVKDPQRAWSNVHRLLAPGGIGIAFVPTLYSPPFIINKLLPEVVSAPILKILNAERNSTQVPKFPAYYHACRAYGGVVRPLLASIGFREVAVIPFYGTPYFAGIPGVRFLSHAIDDLIKYFDWRIFASYAYIVARK